MLVNKAEVRRFVEGYIDRTRPSLKGCRISGQSYTNLDAELRALIRRMVDRAPSKKTLILM